VAPKSLEEFALAYEEKDLEWSKKDEHLDLQIKDSLDEKLKDEKDQDDDKQDLLECSQCGYEWESRVDSPKKCPDCQSKKWDK
jgi:rubrerythrin